MCEGKQQECSSFCQGTLIGNKIITSQHCVLKPLSSYQNNAYFRCGKNKSEYSYFLINSINKFSSKNDFSEFSSYNEFQENDLATVEVKPAYHYRQEDPRYSFQKIKLYDFSDNNSLISFWGKINKKFQVPEYFRENFDTLKQNHRLRSSKNKIYEFKKHSVAKAYLNRKKLTCFSSKNLHEIRASSTMNDLYPFTDKFHWGVLYRDGENYTQEIQDILEQKEKLFHTGYLALPYFIKDRILRSSDSGGSFFCSLDKKNFFLLGIASTSAPTWTLTGIKFNQWAKVSQVKQSQKIFSQNLKNPHSFSQDFNLQDVRKLQKDLIKFNRDHGSINCQLKSKQTAWFYCEDKFSLNLTKKEYKISPQTEIKAYSLNIKSQKLMTANLSQTFLLKCESPSDPVILKNNRQAYLTVCHFKDIFF
ncbi:hypothetical protein N9N67_01095 [Bacteriovoracaceae bacterium]|nr:hypothetical protein [Bacteriovoracaceae bacterium]